LGCRAGSFRGEDMTQGHGQRSADDLTREGVTEAEAVTLVSKLISIPSVNPRDVPGDGEQRLSEFVAGWLSDAGIATEQIEVRPGRTNVLAKVPGRDSGRVLLLEAHLDTVEVDNMTIPPFMPALDGGRI